MLRLDGLRFETHPHLAVAVSGGADSMALVLLAQAWVRERGGQVSALHVDHALRPESAEEAAITVQRLAAHGVACHVLVWEHGAVRGNVQAQARRARYALMRAWCKAHGVLHLFTAHHADDQAETFAMRVLRGSGVEGLSAMPRVQFFPECRHVRPLLSATHAELVDWLAQQGVAWVEDPSNNNPRFTRASVRAWLATLR